MERWDCDPDASGLIEFLPVAEKYGSRSQIRRSAVSTPSNIAEGCSRSSRVDFKRFLEIALGHHLNWKLNKSSLKNYLSSQLKRQK